MQTFLPLLIVITAGAPALPLPQPAVVTYGIPLSYDAGMGRQIPPYEATGTIDPGFRPDYYRWAFPAANVIAYLPSRIEEQGTDPGEFYTYWHKRGKILLYSVTHDMHRFGQFRTEEEVFALYAGAMQSPHVDGISIDEFGLTWSSFEGQEPQTRAAIGALKRLKEEFPDKYVVVWLAGWTVPDWDSPLLLAFLNALNDHTDLICAELYNRESACRDFRFPVFRDVLDRLEHRVPGILRKTVPALYLLQHPPSADNDPEIEFSHFLEKQIEWIQADPVLRELPGVAFFAPYRAFEGTLVELDSLVSHAYSRSCPPAPGKPPLPQTIVSSYGLPLSFDRGHNRMIPPLPPVEESDSPDPFRPDLFTWSLDSVNVATVHPSQVEQAGEDLQGLADYWHGEGKLLLSNLAVGLRIYHATSTVDEIYSIYAGAMNDCLDGVSIDEFMLDWIHHAPGQAEVAAEALKRLREDYPDKIIAVWVSGWWGPEPENEPEKAFLQVLRDHTDLVQAEIYYKPTDGETVFPRFREYIDRLERCAPGILEKTIIGLYTVEHPPNPAGDPEVSRADYLERQFRAIAEDPVLRELPGIAFFAPYRCYEETLKTLDGRMERHGADQRAFRDRTPSR